MSRSEDLQRVADEAMARFGALSARQLNWRPGPGQWSVAQCFEHLIVTQTQYFPLFRRLASGDAIPTTWERYSPFSKLFGGLMIRSLDPDNPRKTKTTAGAKPSTGDIDGRVIERFLDHQRELASLVRGLPTDLDAARVIVTSPLSRLVTYSLEDCLTILVVHGQRHTRQAQRVVEAEGFPV